MSFVDDLYDNLWSDYATTDVAQNQGDLRTISNVVKVYNNMLQITIYHNNYTISNNRKPKQTPDEKKQNKQNIRDDNAHRSFRRSRIAVHDYIVSNHWDYWCTFTFSPKKVDRYDFDKVTTKMSTWLWRQKDLKYIIVPEQHKDGAFHFHALISNYKGNLYPTDKKTRSGQSIFRANFGSGHHEFVKLDENTQAIASYMTKNYMTKQDLKLRGHKRYWVSRGLHRPYTVVNGLDKFDLWSLVRNHQPALVTESFELHQIARDFPLDYDQQLKLRLADQT